MTARVRTAIGAIWTRHFAGEDQRKNTASRSRGRFCPSFAIQCSALLSEGAGKTGCALHPRSRVQIAQEGAHEHTGPAESIRPSLRNGFTAYAALFPATNSLLSPSLTD